MEAWMMPSEPVMPMLGGMRGLRGLGQNGQNSPLVSPTAGKLPAVPCPTCDCPPCKGTHPIWYLGTAVGAISILALILPKGRS